jgi:hypothetical protein
MSGKVVELEEIRVRAPSPCNFKRGFNGDYGVKHTPDKLRTFYETDCPAFGVEWPVEGSLHKVIVNRVF